MRNTHQDNASAEHSRKSSGGKMSNLCQRYRGYTIEVRVSTSPVISLSCMPRLHYNVFWSVGSVDDAATPVTSVPERIDFISCNGAYNYGEKRAREFIDRELASVTV
ncbi:hypothetical protein [Paraburkholderia terrae]|nr:hypothetical protein [Paraburkholderia terrae]